MEVKRNLKERRICISKDDEILLETDHIGGEFLICIRTHRPITITKEIDEHLYANLKELFSNEYIFDSYGLSYRKDNTIVWFSDQYCNVEDEKERKRINRLILTEQDDEIQISFENPELNRLGIKKRNNYISFSPCGNGSFSKNLNSGLSFQDDIVCLFDKTLNYESNNTPNKRLIK